MAKRTKTVNTAKRRVLRTFANKDCGEPEIRFSAVTVRVMNHPHYEKALNAMRAGTSVPKIAQWFDREGWLDTTSVNTFIQMLYKFRSERADLVAMRPVALGTPDDAASKENYDAFIGYSMPDTDPDIELDKLIALQRRRVSTDVALEFGMGKLLESTHKEIKVLGELLALKKGPRSDDGAQSSDNSSLRTLRVNEGEQDRMQELTGRLIGAIQNDAKNKAKKVKAGRG